MGDFEVGGGRGDEVGGDLAVDWDEGGLEGGFCWLLDDFADVVEGRDDGSLWRGISDGTHSEGEQSERKLTEPAMVDWIGSYESCGIRL